MAVSPSAFCVESGGFYSHALHFSECVTFAFYSLFSTLCFGIPYQNRAGRPPSLQFCREGKRREGKGREAKGSEGNRREAKGSEGKGSEAKGRETNMSNVLNLRG